MPNWAENELTVQGSPEEVARFIQENEGPGPWESETPCETPRPLLLSFHAQVPMPKSIIDARNTNTADDKWYSWATVHWGTKWELSPDIHREVDSAGDEVRYCFDTAWSPPEAWLAAVAAKYPALAFELLCFEGGGDYAVRLCYEDGVSAARDELSYRAGRITWKGSVIDCCEECGDEFESTDKIREEYCPTCLGALCVHCGEFESGHVEDSKKCVFRPTHYEARNSHYTSKKGGNT